jgi:molybdenum-dependent DNA-binding transcriptional regulator ModE
MEISTIAARCAEKIQNDLEKKVTDDRINAKYTKDQLDYDVIDYFYYDYTVNYDDVVTKIAGKGATSAQIKEKEAEILAEYKKQIEEVKEVTKKLAAAKTLDEFKKIIFDDTAYDKYDELLANKEIKDDKKPAKDDLTSFREKIVAAVIAEVLKGDDKTTDEIVETTTGEGKDKKTTYTLYGTTLTEDFAKAIKSVRESLFTALDRINDSYDLDKSNYSKDNDFKKWAFDKQRKDGETKSIAKGDGASDAKFEVKEKKYTETVYFLKKAQYKLTENTRNVTYMLLSGTEAAKTVIAEIKKYVDGGKTLTVEKFNEFATKNKAAYNASVDNYVEGNMGSAAFDEWLFDKELKKGAYTAEPINMSDGSVMVAFYEGEGEPTWKMLVKNTILNDDFSAREDKMTAKYSSSVVFSDWVINRVGE